MSMSLAIQIGNKEYNVIGENEQLVRQAAAVLNDKIQEITTKGSSSENISHLTKTTLAALNIAENELKLINDWKNATDDIVNEIQKIAEFIETNINNPHF